MKKFLVKAGKFLLRGLVKELLEEIQDKNTPPPPKKAA